MKLLYYLIIAALALLLIISRRNDASSVNKDADTITITNTVRKIQVDTMYILSPQPYLAWIDNSDTIHASDTCYHLREYKEYRDSSYYAKISGVAPRLDEIRVYPRTIYQTEYIYRDIVQKNKRWGLGLSAGYGIGRNGLSPILAVTVNYNLFQW
ncbi:hypothetical protein DWY45_02110 [Phocaeicola plebeius]|jgi:hypothetical protein|uniref:DUF6808 domain-containing protein n=2 Tax=Phocaeicola plebeius TaxID=310297 RepID=A0A414RJN0_9BACT|nr:hypothetical protein [Phocaeicola plebeius]RGR57691.1 hypothetical protein DWY45_02110 [Phocaeicola plebeius]RHF93396.1 hypothetical protein DW653_00550 [Phocaeicola plebeius]